MPVTNRCSSGYLKGQQQRLPPIGHTIVNEKLQPLDKIGDQIVAAKVSTDESGAVLVLVILLLHDKMVSLSLISFDELIRTLRCEFCSHVCARMVRRVDITDTSESMEMSFSYAVEWYLEELAWKDRLSRYFDSRFVPSPVEIHWLSIINSFVLVLLLTAFLAYAPCASVGMETDPR